MAENVETGGVMKFNYKGREEKRISEEMKRKIEEGYKEAGMRKAKEKRERAVFWLVGVLFLILLIGLTVYFLKG